PNVALGMPVTGCGSAVWGMRASAVYSDTSGLPGELGVEVAGLPRNAVLVGIAVGDRRRGEVSVRRRRGRSPLQRGRVPRVLRRLRLPQGREEVPDERQLRTGQAPGRPGDEHVQALHGAALRVAG